MADVYGLTDEGFFPKTLEVLIDDIRTEFRDRFGTSIDLAYDTPEGVLIGIVGEALAKLWELGEKVHASQSRASATGAALAQIGLLTNSLRRAATKTAVVVSLTGTPTTNVPSGSQVSTASTAKKFETLDNAVIASVSAWTGSTAYAAGTRVHNSGNVYAAMSPGISAGSGGPTSTDPEANIADGTLAWRFVGPGTGVVDVDASALETGPTVAVSGDVTVIETPIAGWAGVNNVYDASIGANVATDGEFRIAQENDLQSQGRSPLGAIRSKLIRLADVSSVTVFHNNSESTNADGMPPHTIEALVEGGDDQEIFDTLLENVAGGIRTHGNVAGFSDDEGTPITMKFSRPVDVDVWIKVTLTKNPAEYPIDGDDQVKLAIVAWGDAQRTGRDVVASAISAQAFKVPGVLDVTELLADDVDPPVSSSTISLTVRQRAVYDTSRITVVATDGEP